MSKKQVYISKSRNGDFDITNKLITHLKKTYDCNFVEFTGGTYSNKLLLESDYLVVIPPIVKNETIDCLKFSIGKGQHQEIIDFRNEYDSSKIFILTPNESVFYTQTSCMEIVDKDWKIEYSTYRDYDPEYADDFDEYMIKDYTVVPKYWYCNTENNQDEFMEIIDYSYHYAYVSVTKLGNEDCCIDYKNHKDLPIYYTDNEENIDNFCIEITPEQALQILNGEVTIGEKWDESSIVQKARINSYITHDESIDDIISEVMSHPTATTVHKEVNLLLCSAF